MHAYIWKLFFFSFFLIREPIETENHLHLYSNLGICGKYICNNSRLWVHVPILIYNLVLDLLVKHTLRCFILTDCHLANQYKPVASHTSYSLIVCIHQQWHPIIQSVGSKYCTSRLWWISNSRMELKCND